MPRQALAQTIADALVALPRFLTAPLYRHWHLRRGATDAEVAAAMPGDDIVPDPSFTATRAITIAAPSEEVWPWIVQSAPGGPAHPSSSRSVRRDRGPGGSGRRALRPRPVWWRPGSCSRPTGPAPPGHER